MPKKTKKKVSLPVPADALGLLGRILLGEEANQPTMQAEDPGTMTMRRRIKDNDPATLVFSGIGRL